MTTVPSRDNDRSKTHWECEIFQLPGWPDKSDIRCKRELKSRNAIVKAEFNKKGDQS